MGDGSASFGDRRLQVSTTVRFPFLADHPVETEIAIIDIGQEAFMMICQVLPDTRLNVLIALTLGETMLTSAWIPSSGDSSRTYLFIRRRQIGHSPSTGRDPGR